MKGNDISSKARALARPTTFMKYNGGAESGVDKPTLSSKILSTFCGKKTGRE
jgi:hypothetical protein